ncbi:hypothetical protein [Bizionia arctica]|uniref:Nicotinate-nucleotide adenylyltransferase n=1 Tax=Bizionia arctica TaxID=1495645 RepID=A0A917GIZ5_9FLAO|nr:hypothetical protein [Bizionia arctica]GGG48016.1 hypothetical protein GCM10010976_19240 [Bizionia arctica]
MKTYVLGFLFLGLTNLTIAQNDLAVVSTTNQNAYLNSTSSKTVLNSEYIKTVDHVDQSKKMSLMQNLVANYDIKTTDIYRSNSEGSYTIDFKEGENAISAIFDNKGSLISCEENYQAIKLPYAISSKLVKDYPNWSIKAVECEINYVKDSERTIVYKVAIKNGQKSKNISIKV